MTSFTRIDSVLGLRGDVSTPERGSLATLERLNQKISKAIKAHKGAVVGSTGQGQNVHPEAIAEAATALANATKDPEEQWNCADFVCVKANMLLQMAQVAAIRCFMAWRVFEMIPACGSVRYGHLARQLDADRPVIARLAGILVASGILQQVGQGSIAHTDRSRIYANDNPSGELFQLICDEASTPWVHLYEYLAKHGTRVPSSATVNPHTFALTRRKVFMLGISRLQEEAPITNLYHFSWLVEKGKRDRHWPLLVDVRGGKGPALRSILKDYPGLDQSRCVLQALDPIIAQATEEHMELAEVQGMRLAPHDFSKEQNVKGAYVYLIRRCLHDWSDEQCIRILRHFRGAMRSSGRILICAQILSSLPSPLTAQLDLCMMNLGGKKRTPQQFRALAGIVCYGD